MAEDDRAIRTVLVQALCRSGYQVRSTGSAAMLWRWIEEGEGNLVITDVILPDGSGLELLPKVHRVRPKLRVIIMSAHSTLTMAVNATQRGAFEYLPKPFELSAMLQSVGRALAEPEEIVASQSDREVDPGLALLGRSPAMQEIYRNIARLAPTDLTVMISGESGTGKELVARALHEHGRRRNGPFVAINMAAIPRDLIESELFGHERGAFTGADRRTIGRFEQAAGGTLFLDEIGDMPPEAQTRLLRVLQEGEFTPVGSRQKAQSNVRIVAATHRDLRASIGTGTFREDLFYRLNVAPIRLPPLRERLIDIPLLANTFLERAREAGLPFRRLSESALQRLATHRWPGNVRELENLILRLAVLSSSETISGSEISAELDDGDHGVISPAGAPHSDRLDLAVECYVRNLLAAPGDSADLHTRVLAEVERPLFRRVLAATRGNQIRAAAILGLNRNTLRKKLRDLDIAPRHEVG